MSAVDAGVVRLLSNLGDHATTAGGIIDEASMDGSATDEGVRAVVCMLQAFFLVRWSTNYQGLVIHQLIANWMRVEQLNASTICRATKRHRRIFEGAAEVSVEAAAISIIPETIGTSDPHRTTIARNISCECATM